MYKIHKLSYCHRCINYHSFRYLTSRQVKDYQDTLHIGSNASAKEVKESFLRLSKIYHPDNNISGSHDKFLKIKEAYDALKEGSPPISDQSGARYSEYRHKTTNDSRNFGERYGFNPHERRKYTENRYDYDPFADINMSRANDFTMARNFINTTLSFGAMTWIVIFLCFAMAMDSRSRYKDKLADMRNPKNLEEYLSLLEILEEKEKARAQAKLKRKDNE